MYVYIYVLVIIMSMCPLLVSVPYEMKAFLDKQPNKSEFIRLLIENYQKTQGGGSIPLSDSDIETINTQDEIKNKDSLELENLRLKYQALPRETRNAFAVSERPYMNAIYATNKQITLTEIINIRVRRAKEAGLI